MRCGMALCSGTVPWPNDDDRKDTTVDIPNMIFFAGLIAAAVQFYRGWSESRKMGRVVRQCRSEIGALHAQP